MTRWVLLGSTCLTGACAGSNGPGRGFDLHFADNRPADIGAAATAMAQRPVADGPPLVIVVPPPPAQGLTAFALGDGRRLWQASTRIDARPAVVGGVVVSHGEHAVVGWDAASGQERWRTGDHGFGLIGADGDGDLVALSLGAGGLSQRRGVFLVLDARTGTPRMEQSVEQALGMPTVVNGYAVIPWNGQYLSVFDVQHNEERARIRATDDVYARAQREGNAVYFGSRALYRLGAESGNGHREGSGALVLPREDLPGTPPLMNDGYTGAYAGVSARERVSIAFRADPGRPGVETVDGALYVLFHRVIFALDARSPGNVRWAYTHTADIAGLEPVRGGLLFVDERGELGELDAHGGNVVFHQDLATPVAQAVLHAPIDFAPHRSASPEPPQSPASTLLAVASSTDNRLLPARLFAIRALGALPGDDPTRGLLDVASHRAYPQEVRAAAGDALAHRTEGTAALLEALNTHYDYVRQTLAPPIGFIAQALLSAHERRGVAGLVAHLRDPETPASDLPPLVAALRGFGDASAVPALLDFIRLYHADLGLVPPLSGDDPVSDRSTSEQEAISSALEQAVQAVSTMGDPGDQRWLQAFADDPSTIDALRSALERLAQGGSAVAAGTDGTSSGSPGATPDAEPEVDDPNLPPPRLSIQMIQDGFAPTRDRMLACLEGMSSRPAQIRITFRYDSDGNISTPTITPATLQGCLGPLVGQVHLRHSQVAREIGTYYLIGGPL